MTALVVAIPAVASAATSFPSDSTPPDLVKLLSGYNQFWQSDTTNDLHGTVLDASVLKRNDMLAVWINNNATKALQFRAMQDSEYNTSTNSAYDESLTISTALGSVLGPLDVKGTESGKLPLVQKLINSSDGTTGAYVGTSTAKAFYSYPRPYLPTDPNAAPVKGDAAGCAPDLENGSSLTSIRVGQSYADAKGNLKIHRVADVTDTTH